MKTFFSLALVLAASPAFAVNNAKMDIACWDVKSERGSKPVITFTAHYNAQERDGATIKDIVFPNQDAEYEYFPRAIRKIEHGVKITKERSPYKGNHEYDLQDGIRLILAADVTDLENADVDGRGRGHGAVLDIDQSVHKKWSGGNFYIRMRCRESRQ